MSSTTTTVAAARSHHHAAAVAGDPLADVKEQPAPGLLVAEGTAAVRPDRQRDPLLLIRTLNFIGDGVRALRVAVPVEQAAALRDLGDKEMPLALAARFLSRRLAALRLSKIATCRTQKALELLWRIAAAALL